MQLIKKKKKQQQQKMSDGLNNGSSNVFLTRIKCERTAYINWNPNWIKLWGKIIGHLEWNTKSFSMSYEYCTIVGNL